MGHVEQRAKQRTSLTDKDINRARSYVRRNRKSFKKGQTYSIVAPGRKGYYIVGDVGDKRKNHVIKTVYGANMNPPGNIIQNAKLEHDLIKAAEALFSLEKTASAVSYSVALMEYDKVASAYFGYSLEEWLEYPEEMRKEASRFQSALGGLNLLASKGFNRLGMTGLAKQHARGAARRYGTSARNIERQSMITQNQAKATELQARAAEQSSRASQQARIGGDSELAKRQAAHAQRQVGDAQANIKVQADPIQQDAIADYTFYNSPITSYSVPTGPVNPLAPPTRTINPDVISKVRSVNTRAQQVGQAAVERNVPNVGRVERATEAVKRRLVGNPNIVRTPKPSKVAPTNTGAPTTTTTPPKGAPPKAPTSTVPTDANNPINLKQVGIGAAATTGALGLGYGGTKYIKHRNRQKRQQAAMPMQQPMTMPKMASWYSFVEKTASYSDALGMYKEALSRADKNLLKEYQNVVREARAAGGGVPTIESFLKNKGYSGKALEVTKSSLDGKLFGREYGQLVRPKTTTPVVTPPPVTPSPVAPPPVAPSAPAPLPEASQVNPQQASQIKQTETPPKNIVKQQVNPQQASNPVVNKTPSTPKPTTTPAPKPKGRLGMILGGTALAGAGLYGLNRMMQPSGEKAASVEYRGRTFPGYNKPMKSDRPNKKKMVLAKKGDKVKLIHYGHSGYKHNYSKSAKKNYLTRSAGIRNKSGGLTMNDKFSANYWARRDLWPKGQKADGSDKKR